ncbi:18828_t:CDS:2 [Racocetra fulgida]|uniref:18828_t:CDS:1 n=1 Tax=Racocetra fulgida TaxID=60492 RepID=A0A9N9F911_9GLOM|nr:18828_t:CDS:2 [Racocetra fulgida]
MLTTNVTKTEKLKLLVIRSSIKPNTLVRLNYDALSVTYRSNLKTWMQTDIFYKWLLKLDEKFCQDTLKLNEELSSEEELSNKKLENKDKKGKILFMVVVMDASIEVVVEWSLNKDHHSTGHPYTIPDPSDICLTNICIEILSPKTTMHL